MLIKTTKAGKIQAVVNGETFDIMDKGENNPAQVQAGIDTLQRLSIYKVAEIEATKAAADAELEALKPTGVSTPVMPVIEAEETTDTNGF